LISEKNKTGLQGHKPVSRRHVVATPVRYLIKPRISYLFNATLIKQKKHLGNPRNLVKQAERNGRPGH
jgi:hypothetical protein